MYSEFRWKTWLGLEDDWKSYDLREAGFETQVRIVIRKYRIKVGSWSNGNDLSNLTRRE
jgi:hypothetical protein